MHKHGCLGMIQQRAMPGHQNSDFKTKALNFIQYMQKKFLIIKYLFCCRKRHFVRLKVFRRQFHRIDHCRIIIS